MPRLIGTAGHVDHGKTTLIHALTGIDADRLPEEKSRGMTIDIGFAYVDLPSAGRVSIVDVPGHEKFLTNMLVGALAVDLALLVVAADSSVMPQTREHFQILELLPVQRMVVALTRSDLADEDMRAIARAEITDLLAPTRFKGAPIVEVSAVTGQGIERLKAELEKALLEPEKGSEGPWYLPIDRAFTVKGHGTVVTGTLAQGTVRVGDRAILQPGGIEARIRAIHTHGEPDEAAGRGRRTALNLGGVRLEQVHRGMAIGAEGALFESKLFDARIRWLVLPKHGLRVRVAIGAAEGIGRVFLSDADPDQSQFRLESSVACALGQPVIVRRYSPPDLFGGGRITVPIAKSRRRSEAASAPEEGLSPDEAILQILSESPSGIMTEEICRRLGKSPQALGTAFEALVQEKKAIGFAGLWFEVSAFLEAGKRLMTALDDCHAETPQKALIPREKVVERAGLSWQGKPLDRIVAALAHTGRLRADGTGLRNPTFKLQLSEKQRAFLNRVVAALDEGRSNPPSPRELAELLHVPVQAVEEVLRLGVEAAEIVRVADGIFFTPDGIEAIQQTVAELGGNGPFTAAEFRDAAGTSRKFAIPLLEYFDAIRFTVRVDDKRMLQTR